MKTHFIVPILTALAGFGIGWMLKPASDSVPEVTGNQAPHERKPPEATRIDEPDNRPSRPTGKTERPLPGNPSAVITETAQADDAKLARLTESLNLNESQEAEVMKAIQNAQATMLPEGGIDGGNILEVAIESGATLENAIVAILTPEQAAAFTALRKRTQDNLAESKSQEQISKLSKFIDLSPEQREMALERVRTNVKNEQEQQPKGLDLVLDTSPLPMGSAHIAASSIPSLIFMGSGENAGERYAEFRAEQRRNLDAQINTYKDILTPAQLSRLQADINEKKRVLDLMEERVSTVAPETK